MTSSNESPVIVALDGIGLESAKALIATIGDQIWGIKINDLAFAQNATSVITGDQFRLFLDLKFHDIPNTVANSVRRVCESWRPHLLTVHASGGPEMLAAAVGAAREASGGVTQILAVTALTSLDEETCTRIYGQSPADVVRRLSGFAAEAGCFGIVCSAHELPIARELGLAAVVPGIRPAWAAGTGDDQRRTATPRDAIEAGARYLVIGRPIVRADDPLAAVQRTLAELG